MLKTYIGYSQFAGSYEGACLIFAHSAREARVVGWQEAANMFTDEYIDFVVRRIRGEWFYKEADQDKLANDMPHVVIDVRSCNRCEQWGQSEISEDGLCEECKWEAELERAK